MVEFQALVAATFRVAHFVPVREILASGNIPYRSLIPRTDGPTALAFRGWFLANARQFDGAHNNSRPPLQRARLDRLNRRSEDPFVTAQALAESNGLGYWEGYAADCLQAAPFAVHHAWNTTGDAVLDVASPTNKVNCNLYLGVSVPLTLLRDVQVELALGGRFYHGPLAFLAWARQTNQHPVNSPEEIANRQP